MINSETGPRRRFTVKRGTLLLSALFILGIALVAGVLGFSIGTHATGVSVLSGSAYSTPAQIGVQADGNFYYVPVDVNWLSPAGVWHSGGRPACLPPLGRIAHVKFAVVTASEHGEPQSVVAWVICAS
ncbi:MAG: hypothetical protein ACRENX_12420 [Candidatus Dormibacteria bacterium]